MSAMSIDLGLDVKDLYRAVIGLNTKSMRGIGFDSVENTPGLPKNSRFMGSEFPAPMSARIDEKDVIPEEEDVKEVLKNTDREEDSDEIESSVVLVKADSKQIGSSEVIIQSYT